MQTIRIARIPRRVIPSWTGRGHVGLFLDRYETGETFLRFDDQAPWARTTGWSGDVRGGQAPCQELQPFVREY